MCTILNDELNISLVIGYKVVAKKGKTYYSVLTGMKYKTGKITKIRKAKSLCSTHLCIFNGNITNSAVYISKFHGYTTLFKNKDKCYDFIANINLDKNYKLIIVKIKGSGKIYDATYFNNCDSYAVNHIEILEEFKN